MVGAEVDVAITNSIQGLPGTLFLVLVWGLWQPEEASEVSQDFKVCKVSLEQLIYQVPGQTIAVTNFEKSPRYQYAQLIPLACKVPEYPPKGIPEL